MSAKLGPLTKPLHRILRNPNVESSQAYRNHTRATAEQNTLKVLEDPRNGRTLHLIGTTNSSTNLANRTQNLVRDLQPDSVLVQTNKCWWSIAKELDAVTQQQMNRFHQDFETTVPLEYHTHFRGAMFKARLYTWLKTAEMVIPCPEDFNPFMPGLEMKYAIEEALKSNSHLHFAGMEINGSTLDGLAHEKRLNFVSFLYRWWFKNTSLAHWRREIDDELAMLNVSGGEAYAECIDDFRASWWIKLFQKTAPWQKKTLVDNLDNSLFRQIYTDLPGNNLVAVVNQWHIPGIERQWRHTTGTEIEEAPINPIGDLNINSLMELELVNDAMERLYARNANSESIGNYKYITHYHKYAQEYERSRHAVFDSYKDSHLEHSLYLGENDNVDNLPYNPHAHH